jgi:hypothetical protein
LTKNKKNKGTVALCRTHALLVTALPGAMPSAWTTRDCIAAERRPSMAWVSGPMGVIVTRAPRVVAISRWCRFGAPSCVCVLVCVCVGVCVLGCV